MKQNKQPKMETESTPAASSTAPAKPTKATVEVTPKSKLPAFEYKKDFAFEAKKGASLPVEKWEKLLWQLLLKPFTRGDVIGHMVADKPSRSPSAVNGWITDAVADMKKAGLEPALAE